MNKTGLFVLIKSLTMSEKRYFKIFSKRHVLGEKNKYILIFDSIAEQNTEDIGVLATILEQKGFSAQHLSADKNYLYKLILRCLNEYYHEHNNSLTIKSNLQTIEILFHKGLYKESLKLITQTEKLIQKGENFQLMLELLLWKRKCSGYAYGLDRAQAVNTEAAHYIEIINNLKLVIDVYYKTNKQRLAAQEHSPQEIELVFKEVFGQTPQTGEERAFSTQAKIFYHLSYAHYHFINHEFTEEYQRHRRIIEIIDQNPAYQRENPMDCIALYHRLLAQSKYLEPAIFYADLALLRNFDISASFTPNVLKQRIFIHINSNEIEHLLLHQKYTAAQAKLKPVMDEMAQFAYPIEPYHTIQITYYAAWAENSIGSSSKALDYTNRIINEYDFNANPPIHLRAQILNCLIHFQLENYKTAEHFIKLLFKKHKTELNALPFEQGLLKMLFRCCRYGIKPRKSTLRTNFTAFAAQAPSPLPLPEQQSQAQYLYWMEAVLQEG